MGGLLSTSPTHCPSLNPRGAGAWRWGGEWDRAGCEGLRLPHGLEGQQRGAPGRTGGSETVGSRGGAQEGGTTHCSSSHQRRPHSPQTGCSDWSSQRKCRPGSGIHPHHRPSLQQHPPRYHQAREPPWGPRGSGPGATIQAHQRSPEPDPLGGRSRAQQGGGAAEVEGLRPGPGVPLTVAGDLIGTVPAVVGPVAPQCVGHTAPIVALAESLLAAA